MSFLFNFDIRKCDSKTFLMSCYLLEFRRYGILWGSINILQFTINNGGKQHEDIAYSNMAAVSM